MLAQDTFYIGIICHYVKTRAMHCAISTVSASCLCWPIRISNLQNSVVCQKSGALYHSLSASRTTMNQDVSARKASKELALNLAFHRVSTWRSTR